MSCPTPHLQELLNRKKDTKWDNKDGITFSFEFFPPKTEAGVKNLDARLGRMRGMAPEFIDYTWGAGGSTSELTMDLCKTAQEKHHYVANMHLTCTNMAKGKVEEALKFSREKGIRNLVVLRGDPPQGVSEWKATDTGFTCALDLVKYVRKEHGDFFCCSVSGYPEGHPDKIPDYEEYLKAGKLPDAIMKEEMDYLKAKIDAGGNVIITQMFYDAKTFLNWKKQCREAGIPESVPIIPGVLPMQNYGGFKRMTQFCKTYISPELHAEIEAQKPAEDLVDDEKKAADKKFKEFGVRQMTNMLKELIEGGEKHIHFYTLNLDESTTQILKNLGLCPEDYSEETAPGYMQKAEGHPGWVA